jgi:hypothetical protein
VSAIDVSTAAQRLAWQKAPVTQWVFESNQIAQNIYANTKPDASLSYNYNYDFIKTLNKRLLTGGIRLAGVLNELFG